MDESELVVGGIHSVIFDKLRHGSIQGNTSGRTIESQEFVDLEFTSDAYDQNCNPGKSPKLLDMCFYIRSLAV